MKKVSIIIPTKNEPYVNILIEQIHKKLNRVDHEIVVVDESSRKPDIKKAKLIRQKSHGLGNAFVEGLQYARGDMVVLMDGDGSHRPDDLLKLIDGLKNSDMTIGSKFVRGGKNLDESYRNIVSQISRKFASFVLGLDIKDTMSGFSAMKRSMVDKLVLKPMGFKIALEIAYKAKKKGYKIKEIPIVFEKRKAGKTKAGISVSGIKQLFTMVLLVLKLKLGLME